MITHNGSMPCPCCAANTAHTTLPITQLVDGGTREIDPKVVRRLVRAGGTLDPILIDSANVVIDGQHRLEAHRAMGTQTVPVRFAAAVDETGQLVAGLAANR